MNSAQPVPFDLPPVAQVVAIDPGPTQSAFVVWNGSAIVTKDFVDNRDLRAVLRAPEYRAVRTVVVIEKVASYGMAVGEDVFATCRQTGRFEQVASNCGLACYLMPRIDVKRHVCRDTRAKDANITAALVDRFGNRELHGQFAKGTKKTPGFFFGFASHHWAAFALAVASWDLRAWESKETT
jgi:hypothetical protein